MNDHDGLDDKLQQLYRQLPKEQPDDRLDELILKAVHQPAPLRRWQQPFAIAASVVMVGSLLLYWRAEQPLQLERALSVAKESAPAPAAPAMAPEPAPKSDMAAAPPAVAMAPAKPAVSADYAEHSAAKAKTASNKAQEEFDQLATRSAKSESEKKVQSYSGGSGLAGLALKDEKTASVIDNNQGEAKERQKRDEAAMDMAPAAPPAQVLVETVPAVAAAPAARAMDGAGKAEGAIAADKLAELRADSTVRPQALAKRARPVAAEALAQPVKAKPVPALTSIEGVSLGMSLEQLQALDFSCGNDVCRKQLSQPEQATYWGMPSLKARFKVFMSRNMASKLVLEQSSVDMVVIEAALGQWGQATDKRCLEEKGELLSLRQQGGYLLQLRRQGDGATLALCREQ